jgi:phosphatidylserine decarboxylase
VVVLAALGVVQYKWPLRSIQVLMCLDVCLMIGTIFFFRNPSRTIPPGEHAVLAPADGTVILVQPCREETYLQAPATKVSIFLSVFNVHVNRIPLGGTVEYQHHEPGKFALAFDHRASDINEYNAVGINNSHGKIFFKQITGFVARRIVSYLNVGQTVARGEIFGMMKFGSRVDIFLPANIAVNVKRGDKVRAGETLLGEIQ